MSEPAFILMTVLRIIPEKVWEAVKVLRAQAHQPGFSSIQGLRQVLLIESQEEPGRLTWLTTWDTKADSQALLSSSLYTNLVDKIHPYLRSQPEWYWYSLLEDWTNELEQP